MKSRASAPNAPSKKKTNAERTYVSSGSQYTETDPTDGKKTTSDYCVQGASLKVGDDSGVSEYSNVSDMATP